MQRTPTAVKAIGFGAFAVVAAAVGYNAVTADPGRRAHPGQALAERSPQAEAAAAAVVAAPAVANDPRLVPVVYLNAPVEPPATTPSVRVEGRVQAINEVSRTLTLDNGRTYTLAMDLPMPALQPGQPVTLAVGDGLDQYTVFRFTPD